MPPKGRTPANPPRRRPRVAGHGSTRPPATQGAEHSVEDNVDNNVENNVENAAEQPVEHTVEHDERPAEHNERRPAAPSPDAEPAATPERAAERPAPPPLAPSPPPAPPATQAPARRPSPARRPRPATPTAAAVPASTSGAAQRRRAWVQLVLLVLVIVALVALAAVFRGQAERASTGAARNQAVIDTGANTELVGQVSKAIETVLSYDYTKLDENEKAAREVITGGYVQEYDKTFAEIRKSATEQKVVLKTTVLLAGVKQLGPERAELIATMNLDSVKDGAPVSAPGRVAVVANRVDGRWKIAQVALL